MHIIGTSQNFDTEVIKSTGLVLVDFWATWCGPCQMLLPIIDEIENDQKDLKVVKVDVDSEPNLASRFNVSSIPTVIIFKDGKIVDTLIGSRPKQDYLAVLKK